MVIPDVVHVGLGSVRFGNLPARHVSMGLRLRPSHAFHQALVTHLITPCPMRRLFYTAVPASAH